MSTFVALGNAHQPFARLLAAVSANVDILPRPIVVQHGHTPFVHTECHLVPFVSRHEFEQAIRSDVVIMHAGAGSILQCLWTGQTPIVMARLSRHGEHIDDHQADLANALDQIGRVKSVDNSEQLRRAVLSLSHDRKAVTPQRNEPRAIAIIRQAIQDAVSR